MLDRVFVYGTLQQGGGYHHLVAPFVRGAWPGTVPGLLLDLGAYPGWVAGPGTVTGEVLRLAEATRALELLDALEDYLGPGNPENLYRREVVEVCTPDGERRAWGYRYVGSRDGCPPVPGGAWPPR